MRDRHYTSSLLLLNVMLDTKKLKVQLNGIKQRCKQKGYEYDLTIVGLLLMWDDQGGKCALSGLPMKQCSQDLYSIHIDRIDSSKGYTMENVQLLTAGLNRLKSNSSDEEVFKFLGELINVTR